ncbi:hypothetical protein BD626DRAFT_633110 [Schizophyllum amplum]|uniref:MYND-type domain-containing protein n=1 Tax=Schizophyllum amplum TaxID=97359 RepID=A0A550C450_9AGAR|nr:hypothetical protein BD626DRAFT_633110 [Auriculariopsis ampla]
MGHNMQMLRCSTCKDRLYCSPTCQKKDWKLHRMNCSFLPVPLEPVPISPCAALTAEVQRASATIQAIVYAWSHIDDIMAPIDKNNAKMQLPSFRALAEYQIPHSFASMNAVLDNMSPTDRTLHAMRRLYWIDAVANMRMDENRQPWLVALRDTLMSPPLPKIIPEKALARPGELSVGEYEAIEQVTVVTALQKKLSTGDWNLTAEKVRWSNLATVYKQSKGSWLLDFM